MLDLGNGAWLHAVLLHQGAAPFYKFTNIALYGSWKFAVQWLANTRWSMGHLVAQYAALCDPTGIQMDMTPLCFRGLAMELSNAAQSSFGLPCLPGVAEN